MIRLTPSALTGRKEQLAYIINLIFIATGIIFIIHDYFSDYLVDGYWSPGSVREVELIVFGVLVLGLLRMGLLKTAKLITSLSLILIFFVSPIFITLNYLEMYYINTLLLPVIVLIPSLVYAATEDRNLILWLFVFGLLTNFACEQVIFRFRDVTPADLDFYNYHVILFSMAKILTSLFIYVNITRVFRQNELFEMRIMKANEELNEGNLLIQSQKQKIEDQNIVLRKNAEELKNLDVAKSHFFANISHEFRTPLTLLLGPLGEQARKSTDPADREQFTIMKRSATRLLNLVNQLLDLSKLESGSLKLQAAHGELAGFIKQLASQFRSVADSRQIEFKVDTPPLLHLWFDGDKVEKIVTNILGNAFKFTPAGGVISLTLREAEGDDKNAEGYAEIEISDSGIGIEEDKVSRIFDRFYQVSDSSRREYEGTGIGLALVKELTEVHHGAIRVFSHPGQGSIFTVRLPLGKAHLREEEIAEQPAEYQPSEPDVAGLVGANVKPLRVPAHSEENPHVLVVEDNTDLQRYLAEGLSADFRLSFAMNGEEGINLALAELPDLIVSDLMMPKVDGMVLLKQVKTDPRTSHIPIILLTAKADAETRLEGIEGGADDYVAKPFDRVELKARIENLIESRRLLREKFSAVKVIRPNDIEVVSVEDRFMKKILTSIETHMADNLFGVSELAEESAMSTVQLYRKVKALTGATPLDLMKNMRLDRAKHLLEQRAGNVSDVAVRTGFRNMSYFAKCFKERYGINPSELQPGA
ncbi:MAG: response regulator [Cyclobacteriaceae bacterium]|nr:response regulator [Cyclobacteriaceae bacterium]